MSDKPISNEESDRYYDRYQRSRDIPPETEVPAIWIPLTKFPADGL